MRISIKGKVDLGKPFGVGLRLDVEAAVDNGLDHRPTACRCIPRFSCGNRLPSECDLMQRHRSACKVRDRQGDFLRSEGQGVAKVRVEYGRAATKKHDHESIRLQLT